MFNKIKTIIASTYEFMIYIFEFFILISICRAISLIYPITCYQVGMLMMMFWFLNLYNSRD
jgi:hypothetical protein